MAATIAHLRHIDKLSPELLREVILHVCADTLDSKRITLPMTFSAKPPPQLVLSQVSTRWRRVLHSIPGFFSGYRVFLASSFTVETGLAISEQLVHFTAIRRAAGGIWGPSTTSLMGWGASGDADSEEDSWTGLNLVFTLVGERRRYRDFDDSESYSAAVDTIWGILSTYATEIEGLWMRLTEQAMVHLGSRGRVPLYHLRVLDVKMYLGQPKDDSSLGCARIEVGDDEDNNPHASVARYRLYPPDDECEFFSTMTAISDVSFGFAEAPMRVLELDRWGIPCFRLSTLDLPNVWLHFYDCVKILSEAVQLINCSIACVTPLQVDGIITEYWDADQRNPATLECLGTLEIRFQSTIHSHLFAHFTAPMLTRLVLTTTARRPAEWGKEPEMPWLQHNYPDWSREAPSFHVLEVTFEFGKTPEGEMDEIAIRHDTDAIRQILQTPTDAESGILELQLFWDGFRMASKPGFPELFAAIEQHDSLFHFHVDATPESVQMVNSRVRNPELYRLEILTLYTPRMEECTVEEYRELMDGIGEVKAALRNTPTRVKFVEIGDPEDDGADDSAWRVVEMPD